MAGAAAEEINEAVETQPTDNENPYAGMDEAEIARMRGDAVDEAPETEDQTEAAPEPEPQPEEAAAAEPEPQPDGADDTEGSAGEETPTEDVQAQPVMLPKSRFDAVNQRYREEQAKREELEARLAEFERKTGVDQVQNTPQQDTQLSEISNQIAGALADGDTAKVVELMNQKDSLQMQIFESKLQQANSNVSSQTIENMKYDMLLDQLETARPELQQGSDVFDEAKSMEVVDLVEAFQAKGQSLPDALERALGYVYPEGWRNVQQSTQTTSEAPPPAPEKKQTDTKKNLSAAKSQPPAMTAGEDSSTAGLRTKVNPMDLSDEEFANLTERELAELRGDFV